MRVRVALNLKGLEYGYQAYALLPDEHKSEAYLHLNPQGLVPSLQISETETLTQSLAIIEYLDEVHPKPALLPADPQGRARVRALSQIIGCDIHPLNNLRVLRKIKSDFGADKTIVTNWFATWVHQGFRAYETQLQTRDTGRFSHGDTPTMADICLFAQVLNNARFDIDMSTYPTIMRIHALCLQIKDFANAMPENQPDAV